MGKLLSLLALCAAAMLAGCKKDLAPTYTVTVNADANGSAQADKTSAQAGASVKLTATPDSGYSFDEWIVESGDVILSGNKQASASFTMPAGNVSLKATFTLTVTRLTLVWEGFTQFDLDDVEKVDVTTGGATLECAADKCTITVVGTPASVEGIRIHVPGSAGTIALGSRDLTLTGGVIRVTRDISGVTLVYDPATLEAVGAQLSGSYLQTCDIDLSAVEAWIPIGSDKENPFIGTYDGAGFRIGNLTVDNDKSTTAYAGLFGYNEGALRNIHVDGSVTGNGQASVGGVCGENTGTITDCSNAAEVSITKADYGTCLGGVCGFNNGTITDCSNAAEVSITKADYGTHLGGVCGFNNGTITRCDNAGEVSGEATNIGGVCGSSNSGTIYMCDNTAEVGGKADYIGGVCGFSNSGTIYMCDNAGKAGGKASYIGGVCGTNYNGNITYCFNNGEVSGEYLNGIGFFGGICGYNGDSTKSLILGCRNTGKVVGKAESDTYAGGVCGYSKAGMIAGCYNTGEVYGESSASFAACGGVNGNNSGNSTICACYNIGKVSRLAASDGEDRMAGVCGENYGKVTYCYWGGESNGLSKATGIDKHPGNTANSYKFGDGTNGTGWPADLQAGWGNGTPPTNWNEDLYGSWSSPWGDLGYWNNGNPVYPKEPQPSTPD